MPAFWAEAVLLGCRVPLAKSWTAAVQPHERAVNLLHPDGFLVSLVRDEGDMTPFSVLAPDVFNSNQSPSPTNPAGRASFDANELCIHFGGTELVLGRAPVWEGRVPPALGLTWSRLDGLVMVEVLSGTLLKQGSAEGLLGVLGGPASVFAQAARGHLAVGRAGRPAWELLVGLGPGLTPAGDDFLAGALLCEALALASAGTEAEPARDDRLPRKALRDRLGGTTPAGRTLLLGSLDGRFPAYLLRFAETATGGPAAAVGAVADAVRHGATSGSDALAGFIFRLQSV